MEPTDTIALFTVTFSHLHHNVFERGCEAISGSFAVYARNCPTFTFKCIVMETSKVNCEKGYCSRMFQLCVSLHSELDNISCRHGKRSDIVLT